MNIQTMHIGIDLALQNLNSNLYGVLYKEEKDYFINLATRELIRMILIGGQQQGLYLTLDEIKNYASLLQNYVVEEIVTPTEKVGEGYLVDLTALTDDFYYIVSSESYIKFGNPIISGQLVKGATYIVDVIGSTLFSAVGGTALPNVKDSTFVCTVGVTSDIKDRHLLSNTKITWDGTTVLYELKPQQNRLIKIEDVLNFKNNSFATAINSPISTLTSEGLMIYTGNKFEIPKVKMTYIKLPVDVDSVSTTKVNSDLPIYVHELLVDFTVRKIVESTAGNSAVKQQ